jgi:hypothetical protein
VEPLRILRLAVRVEEHTEARDARAAKDAEHLALVLVKFGGRFAAEDEQVVAEKGLDACEAEMREARAVVEESVYSLEKVSICNERVSGVDTYGQCEIGAVAKMHTLEHAGGNGTAATDLLWLCESEDAAVGDCCTLD